jgi:uncharacterized membrane protein YhaH (DUF805 family)
MNWRQFLFSHHGRVGRKGYWLMVLLLLPFAIASWVINGGGWEHDPIDPPGVLAMLPIIWPALAVQIKRWHDRGKSGWWFLINFIPLIGGIWALVENGFLKGTAGDNRFGPDPTAEQT